RGGGAGKPATHTSTVPTAGPRGVTGARVADSFRGALGGVSGTGSGGPGASCGAPSGTGNIATTVNLAAGSSATFTATGTVAATATGTLTNTATVTAPAGTTHPGAGKNTPTAPTTIAAQADWFVRRTGDL